LPFRIYTTPEADDNLDHLAKDKGLEKRLKAVRKALRLLETDPRHPGLNSHNYSSLKGRHVEDVFESYAESDTPAAYRIFWHYGPGKDIITVFFITPHP